MLKGIHDWAGSSIEKADDAVKDQYDIRSPDERFQVGKLVWLFLGFFPKALLLLGRPI